MYCHRALFFHKTLDDDTELSLQVGAFGDPGRDPRGWCVSVGYAALVPSTEMGVKAAVCSNKFSDTSCPCIFSTNSQANSETKTVFLLPSCSMHWSSVA